jgi:pimeloyl-ACP methyl ester carboxylesterase
MADPFDYRGIDLLDHGRTFLRDIVDALELPTVDIVANSLGGLWSVAFAIDAPGRVSRLALVGAPVGIARRPPLLMLPIGFPLIGQRLGRYLFSNATRDGSRKFFGQVLVEHPERVDDRLLDVDVAHTRRNVESMLSLIACIADWRRLGYRRELILGERWRTLTTPTLLLWPEHDAFGSPMEGEALLATNPNLRVVQVPAAGHLPWIDDPDTVIAELERSSRLSDGAAWAPLLSHHRDPRHPLATSSREPRRAYCPASFANTSVSRTLEGVARSGPRPGARAETPACWQMSSPGAPLGAPVRC